jgi:hypothetical protein
VIQLHILSGKQAGSEIVVRRFPFVVGRGEAHLPLDDAGVWDRHCEIRFQPGTGFTFVADSRALAVINGERAGSGLLRNGDLLELGSACLRIWLTRTEQKTLRWREALTWLGLAALLAGQVALVYFLLR